MDDGAHPHPRPDLTRGPLPGPPHDLLAALAVLTGLAGGATLLGQAFAAGADMVEMQLLDTASSPFAGHVPAALVGLALATVAVVCALRISAGDGAWPSALVVAGLCLAVLVGLLLVVHAAQWSIGLTIADTALVSGATSSGQWVSQGAALVLAGGAVPCLVVGSSRWRAAARRERRSPV